MTLDPLSVTLAGLLHNLDHLPKLTGIVDSARNIYPPPPGIPEALLDLAASLAAGNSSTPNANLSLPAITASVDIGRGSQPPIHYHEPLKLSLDDPDSFFPKRELPNQANELQVLWRSFKDFITKVPPALTFSQQATLLAAFRAWLWNVPYGNDGISLYDHLKLTGAIAACLGDLPQDDLQKLQNNGTGPAALLVRLDFSGIQKFIYRIANTRSDGSYRGASKRLRGRSFYLTLLGDVVADWLLQQLGLSQANLLFNGGGRFDLLAPLSAKNKLPSLIKQVEDWLLEQFHGELALPAAWTELSPQDFADLRGAVARLDHALANSKLKRWSTHLSPEFHQPGGDLYHTCRVCHLTPLPEADVCDLCASHLRLGEKLPSEKTGYLVHVYGSTPVNLPEGCVEVNFGKLFQTRVLLCDWSELQALTPQLKGASTIVYRLNDTDFFSPAIPPEIGQSFRFLANVAPMKNGSILDFEELVQQGEGGQFLGVLKADVDHLGLAFSEGLGSKLTLARFARLSESMNLYFSGRLSTLCQSAGSIYVVYSGGDDLLLLGPWDHVIHLAEQLHSDFSCFVCHNPNLTLSAGIITVKPSFPIHRFSALADEALQKSKNAGRDRISLWSETVRWGEEENQFGGLLSFGEKLAKGVENDSIPSRFVYFLKTLYDQYFVDTDRPNPLWIAKYHYSVGRRLRKEVISDPELGLISSIHIRMPHIRIPVSYASLKIRKG